MEGSWGLKDLKKCQKELQVMIDKEDDLRKKAYLMMCYDRNEGTLLEEYGNIDEEILSSHNSMCWLGYNCSFYGRFYSIINDFYCELKDSVYKERKLFNFFEQETTKSGNIDSLTGARVSKDYCLSLTSQFYSLFDEDIYSYFKKIYKARSNRLSFFRRAKENVECNQDGSCLFLSGVNENFIKVFDSQTISTYYSLVHEYGHAIQNMISPDVNIESHLFEEVASIFPEMVAMYEQQEGEYAIDTYYNELFCFKDYLEIANSISLHPIIEQYRKKLRCKGKGMFYKKVSAETGLKEEELKDILSIMIDDDGVYVLSFSVALELLHIYKKDKKKALELFKSFLIINNSKDIWPFIYTNFSLNEHAQVEFEETAEGMKRKLLGIGIKI